MRIRSARRKQVRKNLKRQALARQARLQRLHEARFQTQASNLKSALAKAGKPALTAEQAREALARIHGYNSYSEMQAALAVPAGA